MYYGIFNKTFLFSFGILKLSIYYDANKVHSFYQFNIPDSLICWPNIVFRCYYPRPKRGPMLAMPWVMP